MKINRQKEAYHVRKSSYPYCSSYHLGGLGFWLYQKAFRQKVDRQIAPQTDFKKEIEKNVGDLKIESPPCCIHLVSNYTFGAVWPLKDRIRIDFRTNFKIKSKKMWKMIKMSANRYLYYLEIKDRKEIDKELLGWIKKAYYLNKKG